MSTDDKRELMSTIKRLNRKITAGSGKIKAYGMPSEFYVVIKHVYKSAPDPTDIWFKTDFVGFSNQLHGGLDHKNVVGVFKDKKQAHKAAEKELGREFNQSEINEIL